MKIQPYLFFDGRCEEALHFYRDALGAEITALMRFKENPEPQMNPPGADEKVMHGSFRIGESEVMVSDGNCMGKPAFNGFSLTLVADSIEQADRLFGVLAEGGQVQMPMAETFFSPRFGMVADRFGVGWMVIVDQPQA